MILNKEELTAKISSDLNFHPLLRIAAKVVSYIFHPLFIPLYVGWFLIYDVQLFPEQDDWHRTLLLISIFVIYTLLPLVTVLLTKALGFIDSVFLKTQKDRIIPYVICEIFYFWGWYVSKNLTYPKELVMFELGIFLSSCIGLMVNTYMKVSMHALSFGVVSAFILIYALHTDDNTGFYISIALLVTGLVCTARLITSNHRPVEIYAGLLLGVLAEVAGYLFT